MQQLGTDLMLVCSSVSPLSRGGIERDAADFHELGARAARRGLRVGYEALAWGRHVHDHREDRKCCVHGTSVSVSVDLGVLRILYIKYLMLLALFYCFCLTFFIICSFCVVLGW